MHSGMHDEKNIFGFFWGGQFKCENAKLLKDTPGWLSGMVLIWGNHGEMVIYTGLGVIWIIILSWCELQGAHTVLDEMWHDGIKNTKAL